MTTDGLPTGHDFARTDFRLVVFCKACRTERELSGADIVATGKGDVPLIHLKWKCPRCRTSRFTDFVVNGSHLKPPGDKGHLQDG
jgi:hypothetical protein